MNYIKRLQAENAAFANQINHADHAIADLRRELFSPKFNGVDLDGSRKDWVSTGDLHRHLDIIRTRLLGVDTDLTYGRGE